MKKLLNIMGIILHLHHNAHGWFSQLISLFFAVINFLFIPFPVIMHNRL